MRQHFAGARGVLVALVLLQRETRVRSRRFAATGSAVTNTGLPTAATLGRGLRTLRRTALCREGRSAPTRFTAAQPDRNQASDDASNWSSRKKHGRSLQDSPRHPRPLSINVSLRLNDSYCKSKFLHVMPRTTACAATQTIADRRLRVQLTQESMRQMLFAIVVPKSHPGWVIFQGSRAFSSISSERIFFSRHSSRTVLPVVIDSLANLAACS